MNEKPKKEKSRIIAFETHFSESGSATRGTMNLGLGLNCPESMPILSLLATEARWNLMDFSWYPL